MKHYTLWELQDVENWEEAVVVFTEDSFSKPYSLEERSYKISHSDNWFNPEKISFSLWGNCLDGKDLGVRLDWYIKDPQSNWKVDYCYIIK